MYNIEQIKNKIICGDCAEKLKLFPDSCIDLIITDPPYGIEKAEYDFKDNNFVNEAKLINICYEEFMRLLKPGSIGFIWFPKKMIYKLDLLINFPFRVFIQLKNFAQARHSHILVDTWVPILFFRKGDRNRKGIGGKDHFLTNTAYTHKNNPYMFNFPGAKNLQAVEYLVKIGSNENDLILDPFFGSGTIGVACKNLNRNSIGIEINPEYCKLARKRIDGSIKDD